LWDLVSYKEKHNESNGEENRDGSNDNFSWNYGVEGETKDPEVLLFRERQAKNFMAILLLSHGVPMILSGDEVLRTQQGNNNAYCQDNELSWFDWALTEANKDMLRFVQHMTAFRKRHPCLMRRRFLTGRQVGNRGLADVMWHGHNLGEALWSDPNAQFLAYTLSAVDDDEEDLHVILNMSDKAVEVSLPELTDRRWYRAIDTARPFPDDIPERAHQEVMDVSRYGAAEHSVVVLESR
jgi:glycogen operon protein